MMCATRFASRDLGSVGARPRRGFTLIEVLVAVGIIGLLVGLLIPGVQAAREAGRHAQCVANLRQIGIAMNAYHASHNMFPPGHLMGSQPVVNNGTPNAYSTIDNYSEITFLLPQLEQQPLYSAINFAFNSVESPIAPTLENHTARNTRLSVLLCPSDGEPRHLNSYRFNEGRWGGVRPGLFDGPFTYRVYPSQASVTDGLSQTAFVSERIGGSFGASIGWPRDVKYTSNGMIFGSDASYIPFCLADQPPRWATASGRYWMLSGFYNVDYNHNGPPNDPRPSCGPGWTLLGYGLHPPRSYHTGLVNVLMGDGHVAAVTNSVDAQVWIALGTRDAGDNAGAF